MNPISALIFVVFVGGAVLSFIARMPLPVPIALDDLAQALAKLADRA